MTDLSSASRFQAATAGTFAGAVSCPSVGFDIGPDVCEARRDLYAKGIKHQCEGTSCKSFPPWSKHPEPPPPIAQDPEEETDMPNPHDPKPCPGYGGEECGKLVRYGELCRLHARLHANRKRAAEAKAAGTTHTKPEASPKGKTRSRKAQGTTGYPEPEMAPFPKPEKLGFVMARATLSVTLSPDGFIRMEIIPGGAAK